MSDAPEPSVVAQLSEEITAFNFAATRTNDGRYLFAALHDEAGHLRAGIYGWTWGGTCWIEYLWVREGARGAGLGSRLLEGAEAEARRRGCTQMALTTHSFQAPDFYRRHGFEASGAVRDYPAGQALLVMRKPLEPAEDDGPTG